MLKNGTLSQLCAELDDQKSKSLDLVARSDAIVATPTEHGIEIVVPNPSTSEPMTFGLTEFAHEQLAEKMGIPVKYYDRMLGSGKYELLAKNVNEWMPSKEKRLLRVLNGDVRAILSDRYRPIDNYDILFTLLGTLKEYADAGTKMEIDKCDVTERHMYIRTMLPTTSLVVKDDKVQAMLLLSNSEVGAGRLAVALGMWRQICSNGMWGEDIVKRVHLGSVLGEGIIEWSEGTIKKNDEALFSQVKDTIRTALEPGLWDGFVKKASDAAEIELDGTLSEIIDVAAPKLDMTKDEKEKLLEMFAQETATPAGKTQWGFANAVTRLARDTEDTDRKVELEILGGTLLEGEPLKWFKKVEA